MVFNTGETKDTLKEEYNPEGSVLRNCQLRLLDMLTYLDKVCKKLGIEYRIDSGCVIGAERHQGFVPWDDDIDIVIDKKDERMLCDYLLRHPHTQYVLQCHKTDSQYLYPWNALRDTKSEYLQDSTMHNLRKYRGLQIDIFTEQSGLIKPLFLLSKKITVLINHYLLGKVKFLPYIIYLFQTRLLNPVCSLFSFLFGNKSKKNFSYGIFWWHPIVKDVLYPTKPILFEGCCFPGPANPTKYLEFVYGKNWTHLPPKEKRDWHKASYRIED